MNVTINRQLLGLEDLAFGVGTVTQTRGGVSGNVTLINAANMPFDESFTLQQVLDTNYASIVTVGADLINVDLVATSIASVDAAGTNIVDIVSVANTVVPNIAEILLADDNAAIATAKAEEALTSANNAATSESNASTSESNASTSESNASTSASSASTSATNASSSAAASAASESASATSATASATSATNASTSATTATTKASEASNSATNAASNTILAQSASASAVAAKDAITGYVIPTTATDSLADLKTKRLSQFASSGTIDKQDDSNVFSATVGNEYKFKDNSDFANLDGNIFNFPTGTTVDMTTMMPEVIVQDQATNGLVVQSSVNAGDYVVVDKEELVTGNDSSFDTSQGSWTTSSYNDVIPWSWDASGRMKYDGVASADDSGSFSLQLSNLVVGETYIAKFTCSDSTGAFIKVNSGGVVTGESGLYRADGTHYEEFTAALTDGAFSFWTPTGGLVGYIDNISVQLKEDIYRATEDIPTLTSLTDVRFETRDYISNQVLAYRKSDGTLGYETLFVDATETDTANDVMTKNGWSKLSNGYYSKGLINATPMGAWQTLNKGAYHPMFNAFGTARFWYDNSPSDTTFWYSSHNLYGTSTVNCFDYSTTLTIANGEYSLGSVTARPDSKYSNIIYKDQWIDLRLEANAINPNEELLAIGSKAKSGQVDGVSGLVGTIYVDASDTTSSSSGSLTYFDPGYDLSPSDANGTYIAGWEGSVVYGGVYYTNKRVYKATSTRFGIEVGVATLGSEAITGLTITKTLPILSSGSHLTTDLIGDPANYPQAMKDILASGKPLIGINPLLVSDTGVSLIPDGTSIEYKLGAKASNVIGSIFSDDAGVTLATSTAFDTADGISNSITSAIAAIRFYLVNYTAKNITTKQSDPKAVKVVGNYATGTNSHSVYKGNQLVPTGKVNVGNGANGLESRLVENVNMVDIKYEVAKTVGSAVLLFPNGIYKVMDSSFTVAKAGDIVQYLGGSTIAEYILPSNSFDYISSIFWKLLGHETVPSHNIITLDSSNSPAVKFIETIAVDDDGMAHYQVMAEEMEWDFDVITTNFTNRTSSDTSYINNINGLYHITDGVFEGYYILKSSFSAALSADGWYVDLSGNILYDNVIYLSKWDGDGFGDNNKFNQLTNGTRTDLNGNTVKTIVSSIPLNKYFKRG